MVVSLWRVEGHLIPFLILSGLQFDQGSVVKDPGTPNPTPTAHQCHSVIMAWCAAQVALTSSIWHGRLRLALGSDWSGTAISFWHRQVSTLNEVRKSKADCQNLAGHKCGQNVMTFIFTKRHSGNVWPQPSAWHFFWLWYWQSYCPLYTIFHTAVQGNKHIKAVCLLETTRPNYIKRSLHLTEQFTWITL